MSTKPSFPVRIRTRNVQLNDDLKRSIESEAAALKRFNSRIVDCEVTVTGPGRHHRGRLTFDVVVKVALPGPDVVVHRTAAASIPVAVNQSFATARRRVKRQAHLRRRNGGHPVRVAGPAFGRAPDPTLHGPRLAWLRSRGPGR